MLWKDTRASDCREASVFAVSRCRCVPTLSAHSHGHTGTHVAADGDVGASEAWEDHRCSTVTKPNIASGCRRFRVSMRPRFCRIPTARLGGQSERTHQEESLDLSLGEKSEVFSAELQQSLLDRAQGVAWVARGAAASRPLEDRVASRPGVTCDVKAHSAEHHVVLPTNPAKVAEGLVLHTGTDPGGARLARPQRRTIDRIAIARARRLEFDYVRLMGLYRNIPARDGGDQTFGVRSEMGWHEEGGWHAQVEARGEGIQDLQRPGAFHRHAPDRISGVRHAASVSGQGKLSRARRRHKTVFLCQCQPRHLRQVAIARPGAW